MSPVHENPAAGSAEKPARRRRGRILLSLVGVLSILGLAPVVAVAWILVEINRDALTTSQQELQLLLASTIASDVERQLSDVRKTVHEVAEGLGREARIRGRVDSGRLAELQRSAVESYVVYLRYRDPRGRMVASDPEIQPPPALEDVLREELSRAEGGHGEEPGSSTSPVVVSSSPARDALLVVAAPVRGDGGANGAVAAVVHFGSIWQRILQHKARGQTVFAAGPDGVPFVTNDPQEVLPGMDMEESELVQRFRHSRGRASETTPFQWTVAGVSETWLGSYETTGQGWGIFVQARESDVYRPVREMIQNAMSWATVTLGIAILAAMVFAQTLSRPIDRLAAATRSFADGDFRERVRVRSRNEIGELAETFNSMADQIESHIDKLRRAARENAALFLGTIRALANAIDAKDPYTRGHSVRVNRYSVIIARNMGLSKTEVDKIHVASLLHDVGKIGIHDAILQKPGALTRDEFEVMKTHTSRGAEIMAPIPQMREIIPGLRSHHERWNGTGYPDALTGEEIPLLGRIIAVADTFDAMTTKRPYQDPFTFEDAAARINELKGLAFDETVVEAFNRAYAAGEFGTAPDAVEPAADPGSERQAIA